MSADVAQGAGLRKHRCKFEGIKRRSSGSRCALCASSVRHTRSHDRSRYARQLCRIFYPHCVCNCTKSVALVRRFPASPLELFDKLDSSFTRQRTARRWVVVFVLSHFFFFLHIPLLYSRIKLRENVKCFIETWSEKYFILIISHIILSTRKFFIRVLRWLRMKIQFLLLLNIWFGNNSFQFPNCIIYWFKRDNNELKIFVWRCI